MRARIECGIDNGSGDARIALALIDAREIDRFGRGFLAALITNGGPSVIDIVGDFGPGGGPMGCSLSAACAALGCTYAELRASCEAAHPEARGWDWASDLG